VKLIRDDYKLKTCQRRHYLRDIEGNNSKTLLLYLALSIEKVLID